MNASLDAARTWLRSARRIVAFSGAGLSAESGVPTFRDAATRGHWTRLDPQQLASPAGFARDPELVLAWYAERRRGVRAAEPNAAHRALASRPDILNITQNVDDLLERAGATDVVHLHGTLLADRCHAGCGYRVEATVQADVPSPPAAPACPACGAAMRPAVVWFGESLPADAWSRADEACRACDVLLVIGTSAEVYPAASLVQVAAASGAKIIVVNPEPSAADSDADACITAPAGTALPALLR